MNQSLLFGAEFEKINFDIIDRGVTNDGIYTF